jgi:hypothetical protein
MKILLKVHGEKLVWCLFIKSLPKNLGRNLMAHLPLFKVGPHRDVCLGSHGEVAELGIHQE